MQLVSSGAQIASLLELRSFPLKPHVEIKRVNIQSRRKKRGKETKLVNKIALRKRSLSVAVVVAYQAALLGKVEAGVAYSIETHRELQEEC